MKTAFNPFSLMRLCYKKVFPAVHRELSRWEMHARRIPDYELRRQALSSIRTKRFHCEGGAVFSLLAGEDYLNILSFIVSFQTISDYLDNLCDRSDSLDPDDFHALHEAMMDALNPEAEIRDYYRYRRNKDDGGYLSALIRNCQNVLSELKNYPLIRTYLIDLCEYYCALQVHKHVREEERVLRLKEWYSQYEERFPELTWYEFAACSGSTLGIFCLVSLATKPQFNKENAEMIYHSYFPYVQGLHILLDYLIDLEEDELEGDLNFCTYYPDKTVLLERFKLFIKKAEQKIQNLPCQAFHLLIQRGLLGLYLSDPKVAEQPPVQQISRELLKTGGKTSFFFYYNGKIYRKWQSIVLRR